MRLKVLKAPNQEIFDVLWTKRAGGSLSRDT